MVFIENKLCNGGYMSVPTGYHTINPYLSIHGVPKVIEFLKQTFEATEGHLDKDKNGKISNAEIRIGDSTVLMGEKPADQKPFPAMIYMYVEDPDSCYAKAIEAGAKSIETPSNQPYGDRRCAVEDSSGNQWWIATRIKK
jgi:PhnB protein